MNKTSLLYWWPKVKNLGIPVPRTEIVEVPYKYLVSMLDGKKLPTRYEKKIIDVAMQFNFPLFLRTDMSSAKHQWERTCFVPKVEELFRHIWALIDETLAAGMFGELDPNALVFRKLLKLNSFFTAFSGLPISAERRYFIRDGVVECHHPYWFLSIPRIASIIQSSALVKKFIAKCQNIGGDSLPTEIGNLSPSISSRSGFPFNALGSSDTVLKLYEEFGLPSLEPQERQKHLSYLGCLRARYIPVEKRFTVFRLGGNQSGWSATKSAMEEIDSLRLNLIDLDSRLKVGVSIPASGDAILSCVDSKRTIGIQDTSRVGQDYWIVFHELYYITYSGDVKTQVFCLVGTEDCIRRPSESDWRECLTALNKENAEEIELLTGYAARIGEVLEGYWSIDFAESVDHTWYLVDMAEGEKSWHPKH